MTEFKHSSDREVFHLTEEKLSGSFLLVKELLAIAKKWRSKALMRAERITELESEVVRLERKAGNAKEVHEKGELS